MSHIFPSVDAPAVGIVGLGLLGRNLLVTIARQGYAVVGYDPDPLRVAELRNEAQGLPVTTAGSIEELAGNLRRPRAVLMLMQGGRHMESLLQLLSNCLDEGDLVLDSASYHHLFTPRRRSLFSVSGIHYLAVGVASSGRGHTYACRSLYPGFHETCRRVRPIFESVAASASGEPCVTFIGRQVEQELRRLEQPVHCAS